ncbi:MAG: hypothetical protein WAT92_15110 [Saprospiraceae bacterium]|nr:hypothetical protein [Saprospiraceae bacterium]
MTRITSNMTLFWKLFIPIMIATMMGIFGLALLFTDNYNFDLFFSPLSKLIYWLYYLLVLTFLYFKLFTFKRIEFDEDHFYVTNYFKTIRFPHIAVERLHYGRLGKISARMVLKQEGFFGKSLRFVPYQIGLGELAALTGLKITKRP